MFKLVILKYGNKYGQRTGKQAVLQRFIQEGKPTTVNVFKRSFQACYNDGKFSDIYTLPIDYLCLLNTLNQ